MLALLLSMLILPADTVTGHVVDKAGQPIPQASVEVTDLGTIVTTAADGGFRIVLAPGRYTLTVRRTGFAPAVCEISVGTGQPALAIVLAPSAFRLEPVTVTATRQPLASQLSPLPTAALAGDELRRAQSVSLAHVVAALPGVNAITTGLQIGKPVIRGFSGPRVLVLENGSRLEDYSWSDEDGPSVETAFVRRVELIRGPASVLYGSDAVGGVINVIPAALPDAAGGPGFLRTGFTLSAASNNIELAPGAQVEGARGNMGWRVAAIGRHASNLHTPAGELDNTGFGAFNGEAAAGWRWPSGSSLSARVVHYGGEFKLLEANAPPGETGGPERKAGDERVQITGQRPWGHWRLEAKAQVQRHSLIEIADDSTGKESEQFNLLLQTGSLDLLLHHGGTTFGITTVSQHNDATGREPIVPNASTLSGAAFAFQQWSPGSGRWTLLAGLRADARRLPGFVSRWSAVHERGDSTLKPETSRGVDLGVRWSGRRARFEVAAYHNRLSDFLYITPTAVFIDSLRVYQYGQSQAEMLGGEALVEAEVARGLVARGRVEAVRGTNLTSHEPLPLLPPRRATIGFGWRDRFSIDVDAYARPDRPNPLDIPTAGYALVHLGAGADVRLFGRPMRLDIALRNAMNQRYRSFLSRYKEFAFDPGRNLIVRLSSGYVD